MNKRVEIELLRAMAAGEVVLCHSDLATKHLSDFRLQSASWYQPIAGIGVELFFFVSGFVICMRISSYPTARAFFVSRLLRLLPMYWIFTTLVLLAYSANPEWRLNNFALDPMLLLRSYLVIPHSGYPLLGVGWTLEHEVIFYGIVAIAIFVLGTRALSIQIIAWLLITMGLIGCVAGRNGQISPVASHFFSPYMFAFAFGWLLFGIEQWSSRSRSALLGVLLAVAAVGCIVGSRHDTLLMHRIIAAGLIFYAFVTYPQMLPASGRTRRLVSLIGTASFSIYLSHWFVMSSLGKVLRVANLPEFTAWPLRVFAIAVSIFIGICVFTVLEKPIDRWLRSRSVPLETPA